MSRVLVVSDLWVPFPGGAERFVFNIARALYRDGHSLVAVTGYRDALRFDGPPVVVYELPLDGDGWDIIAAHIDAFRPDVLLTHHVYARTFGDLLVATGIPIVQVVHNGDRMPQAAVAVYNSQWVASHCERQLRDMTIYPPALDDVIADTHGDGIGFVKPIEHKGVDLFWQIVARCPQYRFVVLRGEWQTLETLEEHPNVTVMEPVVDMRDFWRECRAVLVPSISEDAGTVAQEATVNGVPCISTNVEGLRETNGGGMRLNSRDPVLWATAIGALDSPAVVSALVESQREHLAKQDSAGRLAALSALIRAL